MLRKHEPSATWGLPHSKIDQVPPSPMDIALPLPPHNQWPITRREEWEEIQPDPHSADSKQWIDPAREEEKTLCIEPQLSRTPSLRVNTIEVWISFNGQPYEMITIPRNCLTGQELQTRVSRELGIPQSILQIYHGRHILRGQKTFTIPSGTFLRVNLGLPGGNRNHLTLSNRLLATHPHKSPPTTIPRPPVKDSTRPRGIRRLIPIRMSIPSETLTSKPWPAMDASPYIW